MNGLESSSPSEKQGTMRKSNIELLRIIAMFFVVAHHFARHGGFEFSNDVLSINRFWIQFIQLGGKVGVDIFILISGYFLISAEGIKTYKIIKMWGQMFFYSVVLYLVFVFAGIEQFSIVKFVKSLAPVSFAPWWFASAYFILYILTPYINKMLRAFDRKQYVNFLGVLFACWCIIPTITGQYLQSNALLWFIFLYSLSGYLNLFGVKTTLSNRKLISLSVAFYFITFMITVCLDVLGTRISAIGSNAIFLYDMQRIPVFFISLLLFIGFLKTDIKYSRIINYISSAMFGVYLIHEHVSVRPFLWKTLFKNASYADSNILIPYSLAMIIAVFVVCTIIELIRISLFEKSLAHAVLVKVQESLLKISREILQRVCWWLRF